MAKPHGSPKELKAVLKVLSFVLSNTLNDEILTVLANDPFLSVVMGR